MMRSYKQKGVQYMKRYSPIIHIVGVACACLIFTGCQTGPGAGPMPANSGHLIVTRGANFGADLGLVLSVDGKDVGSFTGVARYSDYLSAGQHRLTPQVEPNRTGAG